MTIARTVESYLKDNVVSYAVVEHPRSISSRQTAEAAHVPLRHIAKGVVLADEDGYLMAVIPGDRHVELNTLCKKLGRRLKLVDDTSMAPMFKDCEPGVIPPMGPAYNIETIVDESLIGRKSVCFSGCDHDRLICVDGRDFVRLLRPADYGRFSH